MSYAQQGLSRASDGLADAADRVASGGVAAMRLVQDPHAVVDLSPEALALVDGIEEGLLDAKMAQHAYTANARVVRAADAQADELVRLGDISD